MNKLLALRHWQLLLYIVGLPYMLGLILIIPGLIPTELELAYIFLCALLGTGLGYGSWVYAVGVYLHKKLPAWAGMSLTRFRVVMLFPLTYIPLLVLLFVVDNNLNVINAFEELSLFGIVFMALCSVYVFCVCYTLYVVAKALKTVEQQMQVSFGNVAVYFLGLVYFPIGVWFIQPRINKIYRA